VRDLAWSDKASGGAGLADGIARFSTPGSVFHFTRPAAETYTNPVGESETAAIDVAGYADGGLQMLAGSSARYYVTNNSGARTMNAAQGSFQCEIRLAAVSAVVNQVIAFCYHDANNYAGLFWLGPFGQF